MTKKGIVDPWRIVEPIKPPPRPNRADLGSIDFDADLRVPVTHTFRCSTGGIHISSIQMETEEDALRVLIACLFDILQTLPDGPALLDSIGMTRDRAEWNKPGPKTPAAYLGAEKLQIAFHKATLDLGMRTLVRVVSTVKKRPGKKGADILKKHGITPLLK